MRLENKVAIITGAGSGFGEGIVRKFVSEGCKVAIVDINVEGGERVNESIQASGADSIFIEGDVSTRSGWEDIVAVTSEK